MHGLKCQCGKIAKPNRLKLDSCSIDGWVCSCGQTYYNPEKAEKILLLNKLKKQKYHLKLNKVKSNLILRIPKEVSDALNLENGASIDLELRNSKEIVLHPAELE